MGELLVAGLRARLQDGVGSALQGRSPIFRMVVTRFARSSSGR
jgi:hypothetical protein